MSYVWPDSADYSFSNDPVLNTDINSGQSFDTSSSNTDWGFPSLDDIASSVTDVAGISSDWASDLYAQYTSSQSRGATDFGQGNQPSSLSKLADSFTSSASGLLDKVEGFAKKNPAMSKLAAQLVGGWVEGDTKKNAAKALADSRLNELKMANDLKVADDARFSASVSGLRKPGLLGTQKPLKRIDGSNVFGSNGLIAR